MLSLAEREMPVVPDNYEHIRAIMLRMSAFAKVARGLSAQNQNRLQAPFGKDLITLIHGIPLKTGETGRAIADRASSSCDSALIVSTP